MWRSWAEHPPQIPWAPVAVSLCAGDITFTTTSADMRGSVWCEQALWKPTGIYREEFYQVTGRWS